MNAVLPNFLSVSLPIMVTMVATIRIASWSQNKRFDDLKSDINRRFDDINRRFDEVNVRLASRRPGWIAMSRT
jgi:predicted signal transduction protein with EAL and GGDEF domain